MPYVESSLVGDLGARALSTLLGGYPKFTGRFSPLAGPYSVSFQRTQLGDDGCEAQILYPSIEGTGRRGRYARAGVPSGLADFSSMPRLLFRPLSARRHPCPEGGEPAQIPGGAPLVVFSHGLGGCAEMYTGLCASLASHGFVVCAIEHRDGSGCFARSTEGEMIPYKRYDGPKLSNYTKETMVDYRAPFLRQRVHETVGSIRHLLTEKAGMFAGLEKSPVHLMGHSFGAATMILVSQQLEEGIIDPCHCSIGSVTLLDPWLFPLKDDIIDRGLSHPSLHVFSKPWCDMPEFDAAVRLVRASTRKNACSGARADSFPLLYSAPKARHASFSDAPNWYPGFFTKKFGIRGKNESLYSTHEAVASLVNKSIRRLFPADFSATEPILMAEESEEIQQLELINIYDKVATERALAST